MGFLELNRGPPYNYLKLGAAATIAVEKINNNSRILPNHTLTEVFGNANCSEKYAIAALAALVKDDGADAIIGPACSPSGVGVGKLASVWNTPVVAYATTAEELSNKQIYDTFSRMRSTTFMEGALAARVTQNMGWKKACSFDSFFTPYPMNGFLSQARKTNITVTQVVEGNTDSPAEQARRYMALYKQLCRGRFRHLPLGIHLERSWKHLLFEFEQIVEIFLLFCSMCVCFA